MAFTLITLANTALTCKQIVRKWSGTLGKLSDVHLTIDDASGNSMEDADISFHDKYGASIDYGMLKGKCQEKSNSKGKITVSMNFTRHSFGVDIDLKTTLKSPTKLSVSTFTYSDYLNRRGSGFGILNKLSCKL